MSLPTDLLLQANELLAKELRRPRQASLRRAISAAYYALFHLLTAEAAQLLVSGANRATLRQCLRRSFTHTTMKSVSNEFNQGRVGVRFRPSIGAELIQPALQLVARTFVAAQQARHEADYDHLTRYTRADALLVVQKVEAAFAAWRTVKGSPQADTFLVALLAQGTARG